MLATHPRDQKKLAKKIKGVDKDKEAWYAIGQSFAEMTNYAKFTQGGRLKATLLKTEERMLCGAASKDRVWGIGLNKNAARITWRKGRTGEWGRTLLRRDLMGVRERIRREGGGNGGFVMVLRRIDLRKVSLESCIGGCVLVGRRKEGLF